MNTPVPLFPEENKNPDYGAMYDFFVRCEQEHTHITIPMIRDRFFSGNYSAAWTHVNEYWRWFLRCFHNTSPPFLFSVQGISTYRRNYFIEAHQPGSMKYFYHFVRSIEMHEARVKKVRPRREVEPQEDIHVADYPEEELQEPALPEQEVPTPEFAQPKIPLQKRPNWPLIITLFTAILLVVYLILSRRH